jgi:hypothetical protein
VILRAPSPRTILIAAILVGCLLTAGCTSQSYTEKKTSSPTEQSSLPNASYRVQIAQPDGQSAFIHLDSDIYNVGEILEFSVNNTGRVSLDCSSTPPGFSVNYQMGNGRWAIKKTSGSTDTKNRSILKNGESTPVYRIVLSGWVPGRYRIISDCGPEHEILLRAVPTIAPAPVPPVCPEPPELNATPWIKIDPFGVPFASRPFTIQGTTNLAVGEELSYSIYSVQPPSQNTSYSQEGSFTAIVEEGSCGINHWSAMGEIQATGDFFIGISDKSHKAVTVKRFTVFP